MDANRHECFHAALKRCLEVGAFDLVGLLLGVEERQDVLT